MKTPVYLDNQATTPVDSRVVDVMLPYMTEQFGNPHSTTHRYGWTAEAGVEKARRDIAAVIGASSEEIIFVSGATEANNLAIKGVMELAPADRNHIVTVVTEHKCVLESVASVERLGANVTLLGVGLNGLIDMNELAEAVTEQTALVTVMAVNNEIGVLQPIREIGRIAHAAGALMHCDAAQAFGKLPIDVSTDNIDLLSISGHKIYGPKGIGALYRRKGRDVRVAPQMSGGGQEGGMRAGTLSPALCVGLGMAAKLASEDMMQESGRTAALAKRFIEALNNAVPGLVYNGDMKNRWVGNLNISFPGLDGDLLLANLRKLAISSGAACGSAVSGPSYVLEAIGVDRRLAKASIRMGLGRFTTDEEIDFAADYIIETVHKMGGLKL